jgi:hypothetical protein
MLEITGEYIRLTYPKPEPTRKQRILSFLWPQTITAESRGADWVRMLFFRHVYVMYLGRIWTDDDRGQLTHSEDLREYNKRTGIG